MEGGWGGGDGIGMGFGGKEGWRSCGEREEE